MVDSRLRDDDPRPACRQVVECLEDQLLRAGVQSRRGLVEDQDRRVAQDGAGDGYPLALAPGQARSTFAHHGVEAVWEPAAELVDQGEPGGTFPRRGR